MIYRLRFDRERFLVFHVPPHEIEAKLGDSFALKRAPVASWKEMWQPLDARFSDDSDENTVITVPDITVWFTDNIVLNAHAFKVLEKKLENYGEFLLVKCEGVTYWVLHVTKLVGPEAIDQKRSARFVDESSFVNIENLVFKDEAVGDLLLFRTEFTGYRNVYCSDRFKTLVEGLGLGGLLFSGDLAQREEP